jgi:hypothetical protein
MAVALRLDWRHHLSAGAPSGSGAAQAELAADSHGFGTAINHRYPAMLTRSRLTELRARFGSEASYRLSDLLSYPWAEPLRIFEGG